MSKYIFVAMTAGLMTMGAALADESTTTTKMDNPDYNSSSSSSTTEVKPGAVSSESTKVETSPYGQTVSSQKSYKKAPCAQKTTRTDTETINR